MQLDNVVAFMEALDLKHIEVAEPWVRSTCPFHWLHPAGRDRHPSFGIKSSETSPSFFYCFAHGSGDLPKVIHTLTWRNKTTYPEACRILTLHETFDEEDRGYRDPYIERARKAIIQIEPIDEGLFDQFPSVLDGSREGEEVRHWLNNERGISDDIIQLHDLRYNPTQRVVIVPIRGRMGELFQMLVRHIGEKTFYYITPEMANAPEGTEFPKLRDSGAFFSEDIVDYNKPVLIVESSIEAMTLQSLGVQNTIATCMPINAAQLNRLIFPTIFIGFDNDSSGFKSRDRVIGRCQGKSKLYVVDWGSVGCKDPGELDSREQLIEALRKRREVSPVRERFGGKGGETSIESVLR